MAMPNPATIDIMPRREISQPSTPGGSDARMAEKYLTA